MLELPPTFPLRPRRLRWPEDGLALQALCERCEDHFQLLQAEPAPPTEAQSILRAVPEGKGEADKVVIGLDFPRGQLVGVLEFVRDFREPGEWYFVLMLLAPHVRNRGLGRQLAQAIYAYLRGEGVRSLRFSISEQNEGSHRFWLREGFRPVQTFPPVRRGARDTVLVEYQGDL